MGKIPWLAYFPQIQFTIWMNWGMIQQSIEAKILQTKQITGTEHISLMHTFTRKSEGDCRMPWHITVSLMTHANSTLFIG